MKLTNARIVSSAHDFWLATCGIDTHAHGARNAQNHTPWTAFTADGTRLVCTVWEDQVAKVIDPREGQERRFVVLGGQSVHWLAGAKKRGKEAHDAIERACADRLPVFGFEIVAAGDKPGAVARRISRLHLDRVFLLRPHTGDRAEDLRERLGLDKALADAWKSPDIDALTNGTLFELVDPAGNIPGADWVTPASSDAGGRSLVKSPNGPNVQAARIVLPYLVDHVRRQKDGVLTPLTYSDLALFLGRVKRNGAPMARGMGNVLSAVIRLIESATNSWPRDLHPPLIASIVVLKGISGVGLPDDGIKEFWPGFELMTPAEKRAKVSDEYSRILAYGDLWLKVLDSANLLPLDVSDGSTAQPGPSHIGGWGGGESQAHKMLRLYLLANPDRVGVVSPVFSATEHPLLSGDRLDAFFRTDVMWVGVEVKSILSDDQDLERGLYQAVKYKAVLSAQALVNAGAMGSLPEVKVILIIQRPLPAHLECDAKNIGVTWLVVPPETMA